MNYQIKDQSYKAAMTAMNSGDYVTIISYGYAAGKLSIHGKTFNKCVLQSEKK